MKKHPHASNVVFLFADSAPRAALEKPVAKPKPPQSDTQRRTELGRLLPLWPKEIADLSIAGRWHVIRTLERALRVERRRGRAGHWAYDLARHAALVQSWRRERAALREAMMAAALTKEKGPPRGKPS
ncbi:MAG: hypothetical protein ABL893_12720 [Hyphomicrobium sp.]